MNYTSSELVIDPVLIRKYDVSGPRYTSYPTADRFVEAFGEATFRHWLASRNIWRGKRRGILAMRRHAGSIHVADDRLPARPDMDMFDRDLLLTLAAMLIERGQLLGIKRHQLLSLTQARGMSSVSLIL